MSSVPSFNLYRFDQVFLPTEEPDPIAGFTRI